MYHSTITVPQCRLDNFFNVYVYCRLISLVPIIFLQQYCYAQAVKSSGQLKIHSYHNQALYGFSYRNITTSSMQECLQHCLSDCLCQTFQICGNTCQLCSNLTGSNAGQLNSTAIRENIGCNRFEFEHRNNLWVSYLTLISVLWGDLMTLYHYFVHSLFIVLYWYYSYQTFSMFI